MLLFLHHSLISLLCPPATVHPAALNPTYSFGEHKDELNNQLGPLPTTMDGRRHSVSAPVNHQPPKLTSTGSMVRSQSGRVPSGRTFSGRAATTGINHGHKGGYSAALPFCSLLLVRFECCRHHHHLPFPARL
jgi:hypothetical protein